MHIWIDDKYSYTSFKKKINMTKLFFHHVCQYGAVVKELLAHVSAGFDSRDTVFCIFVRFLFFLFGLFLTLLFLLAFFFFILTAHLTSHPLGSISGVLFWKRDFKSWKSSWSAYWPSLRPEKNISCQDMSLLWNSWIFFFSMLVDIMTNNTQYTSTELIYTQHPLVTHWRKLNLPFVHCLNHQYYYPRISTGFAPKK